MKRREFMQLCGAGLAAGLSPAAARSGSAGVHVRWLGGAMLEIEAAGLRILTDPCLGEGAEAFVMGDPNEMFDLSKGPNVKPHARLTPFPGLAHEQYDLVLLSHAHEDHFDQAAQGWLDRKVPLLAPQHDTAALAEKGFAAQALTHGAARRFEAPDGLVTVTAVPAVHSLNPGIAAILGLGSGYLIEVEAGGQRQRIYWAGDTFDAEPVAAALAGQAPLDLFIPHLGAVGGGGALGQISMNCGQAADFAVRLAPKAVMPVHHSTYALYQEGPEALRAAHAAAAPAWQLMLPAEGGRITL
ncbi:MBL fold metallo-hydrolase [Leisingera aquaemixtae]|uniref:MBL fold metallo-hydrolase n=1 Tax=Leisingera aquaemixtae TaxID=1396826 RepID=UPI0021A4F982|nr:MBL fold metallo-hydrolase [Leisingera aquaemixtae]UWQ44653.1 MBL fold metallo-hydrolase [Leisingera aquaemixtae]